MVEKFQQFDSVQITTMYSNGKITYRRGLLLEEIHNGKKYISATIVDSTLSEFKSGIEVCPAKDKKTPIRSAKVKLKLHPCRIVLIEKRLKHKTIYKHGKLGCYL